MSQLLNSYESEFKTLLDSTKFDLLNNSTSTTILQSNKDELFELLEQMDIEINNHIPTQEKSKWRSHMRDLKHDLQNDIVTPLNKLLEDKQRNLLFGDNNNTPDLNESNPDYNNLNEEQRQQLLDSHHVLNKTNTRLQDAQRMANDTEQIGSQIMTDLRSQRETLEHSRAHLTQADTYLDKSVRTLRTMSRRLVANKLISYAIIAVLILLILLVLYSKFH
ncbi:t-SNARE Vti1p [Monosporozyma unispora]|nr:hypothetical protein C6P44_000741 [Kazachstania unispora]